MEISAKEKRKRTKGTAVEKEKKRRGVEENQFGGHEGSPTPSEKSMQERTRSRKTRDSGVIRSPKASEALWFN